jgi:hypothetical protein
MFEHISRTINHGKQTALSQYAGKCLVSKRWFGGLQWADVYEQISSMPV